MGCKCEKCGRPCDCGEYLCPMCDLGIVVCGMRKKEDQLDKEKTECYPNDRRK